MRKLFLIQQYIIYKLKARSAHGVHSPFVFQFINNVLNDNRNFYAFEKINNYRNILIQNQKQIQIEDLGAGSLNVKTNTRKIAEIARNAGKNKKWGELLFKITNYFQPNNILELGTSLGIGTCYLALTNSKTWVTSIEGSKAIAEEAQLMFKKFEIKNIDSLIGNFDDILEGILQNKPAYDLVYIDGNHRYKPTIKYYNLLKQNRKENTVFIFDDIHWSKEMQNAWAEIVGDRDNFLTIDLFQFGLVIFNSDFKEKQHFVLKA